MARKLKTQPLLCALWEKAKDDVVMIIHLERHLQQ